MKKLLKKSITLTMALTVALGASACGLRESGEDPDYDETKSQLYVGTMGGGLGINWVENWAEKFEKANTETVFEEGKKGVQVNVSTDNNYFSNSCVALLPDKDHDIIFTEQVNYYEFVRQETAYDISEWVTEPLTEYGENKSIADKMTATDKEYYGQGVEQKYYGVPFINSIMAINYDMQLFEDKLWYRAAEGEGDSEGFITAANTPRSKGPDGKTGTIDGVDYTTDDGLPATYDEFFLVLDEMVEDGCVPFIWSGATERYVTELMASLVADVEGYTDMTMNYTFSGTAKDLVKTTSGGVVKAYENETPINTSNGYLLKKQEGNYYALKFLERLIKTTDANGNKKYYDYNDCFSTSFTHTSAQMKFLQSTQTDTPIAMLIDGSWWYNEAKETFDYMSGTPGMGHYERKLGMLPLPKATTDKVGVDETTWMNQYTTSVLVRGNIDEEKVDLVKSFFRFIHTDEAMTSLIYDAHSVRPYTFDLVGYEESDFSAYSLQHYKLLKNSKVVQPYSTHDLSKTYSSTIHLNYNTLIPGSNSQYEYVTKAYDDGVTAEQYFEGLANYMNESRWNGLLTGGIR